MKKRTKIVIITAVAIVATVSIGGVMLMNLFNKTLENNAYKVVEYIKNNEDTSNVAFVLKRNGEVLASVNADNKMPLASMSKWTVAIEYAKQVSSGVINPEEMIDISVLNRYYIPNTDGGAQPSWLEAIEEKGLIHDNKTTIREVARGMIMFSSNANTDYLMYRLGIDHINKTIKEMELTNHSEVYPIVAALCLADFIQQETGLSEIEVKEQILNMSDQQYAAKIIEIHRLMNEDQLPKAVKEIPLVLKNMEFQKIWSDRFISATANDYIKMLELINSREYLDKFAQKELSLVVEYIMETPGVNERFEHFGIKGGSTSWILRDARYAEDLNGNKTEVVLMLNELDPENYETILQSMDYLMTFSIVDDKMRDKIVDILN